MSETQSPLIFGYSVLPSGAVRTLKWEDLKSGKARHKGERVWVHLDRRNPEALQSLSFEGNHLLSTHNLESIRETQMVLMRISEELDAVRDRAQIVQEQIVEQRAEEMNMRLFVLSIISALFLPLGFITGLFGVNVGGMPGVESPYAFLILCLVMVGLSGGLFWAFRKMGWLS